jgi:hypothetical protein
MNSDLSRIAVLIGVPSSNDRPSGAGTSQYDAMPPLVTVPWDAPPAVRGKTRSKKKTLPSASPDPFTNPQPGDQVSANGRTRHVLKIEHGHVYYTLGELDSRSHAVSLAGWRAWCKEYGKVER